MSHFASDGYMIDGWGVYQGQVKGQENMGLFPMHDPEHLVVKDVCNWRNELTPPKSPDDPAIWEPLQEKAEAVDRSEQFVTSVCLPGMLERCHHLMGMTECMAAFYEEPEEMEELIDFITEHELEVAKCHIKYIKPDAMFHHDDWGTKLSTFMAPDMLEEFFLKPYQKVYSYYKEHGVELIVHHSDSYAATLVPDMIDMGIDIWQGVMTSNNIPELIKQYGGKISFMGGVDSATIDYPGWSVEDVAREVDRACRECGKLYFIPGASQGLAMSTFPGVYEETSRQIDLASKKYF